jgi:hypothetical protein
MLGYGLLGTIAVVVLIVYCPRSMNTFRTRGMRVLGGIPAPIPSITNPGHHYAFCNC